MNLVIKLYGVLIKEYSPNRNAGGHTETMYSSGSDVSDASDRGSCNALANNEEGQRFSRMSMKRRSSYRNSRTNINVKNYQNAPEGDDQNGKTKNIYYLINLVIGSYILIVPKMFYKT